MVNDSLHISEEEAVAATSEVGRTTPKSERLPGVPAYRVHSIASLLNSYLTQLLVSNFHSHFSYISTFLVTCYVTLITFFSFLFFFRI